MTLPLPDHGRLTDDHGVGVHPDKVILLDRDRLLLPTLPINSHRLLTVPPPVVLSTTLNLLGLGHDGECVGTPTGLVRDGNADVAATTIGHPDHSFWQDT